jgi:hypothetical protein
MSAREGHSGRDSWVALHTGQEVSVGHMMPAVRIMYLAVRMVRGGVWWSVRLTPAEARKVRLGLTRAIRGLDSKKRKNRK